MSYRVTIIDAYDSFVHILAAFFEQAGCRVTVVRNDNPALWTLIDPAKSDILVPGPGPGHPVASGYADILEKNAGKLPVLGVCLGHQAIAHYFGCEIEYAQHLMHGKTSTIEHDGKGCYISFSDNIAVMRYHSIIVSDHNIPDDLIITARSTDDHYIMGMRHRYLPIESVQFHPESIGTEQGLTLIKNFISQYLSNQQA